MTSLETTNLAILSLLELPNIGRKSVINFLSNFEKEIECEFPSNEKFSSTRSPSLFTMSERSNFYEIHNNEKLNNPEKINLLPMSEKSTFFDYRIQEKFSSEFKEKFIEQYQQFEQTIKSSEKTWLSASEKAIKIIDFSDKLDIKILNYFDEKYPSRLRSIPDPPPILYYKGDIDFLSQNLLIAAVGTREPTEYGMRVAEELGGLLANCDIPIVSGLAEGCDAYAQQGCVNNEGQTVAVLAHGLDQIYPKQNEKLSQQILSQKGCLLSEYPPNFKPTKYSFVDRDRLQSGISDAIIVVETGVKGGTMHTVNYCLKQNRILGSISHPSEYLSLPQSAGNQLLISEKKAIPIDFDYFTNGVFYPEVYSKSILKFIQAIFDTKKMNNSKFFEIIEKFHEYTFKKKLDIEKIPLIDEEIKKPMNKSKKTVKNKKQPKINDNSQKNLINI